MPRSKNRPHDTIELTATTLSEAAKKSGISYRTAHRDKGRFAQIIIPTKGKKEDGKQIILRRYLDAETTQKLRAAITTNQENKETLSNQ